MWINFEEIKFSETVKVICRSCGKKSKKVVSVCQTINPFNKKDGVIKDEKTIRAELAIKLPLEIEKAKTTYICRKCEDAEREKRNKEYWEKFNQQQKLKEVGGR